MAMSPRADHIIIRPIVHRVGLFDVMDVSLVGAAPLAGHITRRAS
jgi:hypothetical protein